MAQKDDVLEHLLTGSSIDCVEARKAYNIQRLAAVVHKLKCEGYNIQSKKVEKEGIKGPIAQYKLVS